MKIGNHVRVGEPGYTADIVEVGIVPDDHLCEAARGKAGFLVDWDRIDFSKYWSGAASIRGTTGDQSWVLASHCQLTGETDLKLEWVEIEEEAGGGWTAPSFKGEFGGDGDPGTVFVPFYWRVTEARGHWWQVDTDEQLLIGDFTCEGTLEEVKAHCQIRESELRLETS